MSVVVVVMSVVVVVTKIDSLAIARPTRTSEPLSSSELLPDSSSPLGGAGLSAKDRKKSLRLSSLEYALTENAYATLAE
jgi:hypothetical protein